MSTLTAAETDEIEGIRYRLLDAEEWMKTPVYAHRMPVIYAINDGDIELLRLYDKYLMSTLASARDLGIICRSALGLGYVPSEFITRDHVTVWQGGVSRALRNQRAGESPTTKPGSEGLVCSLMLADMSRVPLIISLIEERGITDGEALAEVIAAMESGSAALSEGVL